MLQKAQWLHFVEKFDGFNKEVTKSFAKAFDGVDFEIIDIKFEVTNSLIDEAMGLSRGGERWFKNIGIESEEWRIFLKNPSMEISIFKKGIPSTALKNKINQFIETIIYHHGLIKMLIEFHHKGLGDD